METWLLHMQMEKMRLLMDFHSPADQEKATHLTTMMSPGHSMMLSANCLSLQAGAQTTASWGILAKAGGFRDRCKGIQPHVGRTNLLS